MLWIRITFMRIQIQLFTLMLIRILLFTLMRIRILHFAIIRIRIWLSKMMQIHADPDPQHCERYLHFFSPNNSFTFGLMEIFCRIQIKIRIQICIEIKSHPDPGSHKTFQYVGTVQVPRYLPTFIMHFPTFSTNPHIPYLLNFIQI